MSLIDLASGASAWRGYNYCKDGKELRCLRAEEARYEGEVSGSNGEVYRVRLDLEHPRSSECTCPHAAGKRIVCKHQVALYFTAFPEEAEKYYREVIEAEEEAEREREQQEIAVIERVRKMKKSELQDALLELLFDGPEWQYERFAHEQLRDYES